MFAGQGQGLVRYLLKWFQIPRTMFQSLMSSWSSSATPTAVNVTVPTGTGGAPAGAGGYYGRAHNLGPDGKIYELPFLASANIMVIDPSNNSVSSQSFGLSGLGTTGNYIASVLHPNGKIYAPPLNTNHCLIFDPVAGTTEKQTWGLTFSGSNQYNNAVLGKDNKIYCVGQARNVLIIDPVANTAVTSDLSGTMPNVTQAYKWIGSVRSVKNDKLYFGPYQQQTYLVIDTDSQTANTTTFGSTIGSQAHQGICNAGNGNLVSPPHNTAFWSQVNPVANTRVRISGGKSIGVTCGADGAVYTQGFQATSTTYRYDPVANTVTSNTYGATNCNGYFGGVLAPNGKAYFWPDQSTNSTNMIVLSTNGTGNNQTNFTQNVTSVYLNNQY